VNVLTSIRRNPYYRGTRPHNLSGLDLSWNLNEQTAFQQVKDNELDEGPIPADQVQAIADRYGVNRSRFWAKPVNCVGWLLFNTKHGLFKNNIPMRKAVNWVLDRKAYAFQAGPYAGSPWTHLLPPGSPGSISTRKLQPYSPGPNIAKARRLAKGHFKDGKVHVYYPGTGTIRPAQAQVVRHDLIRLGFKPENVITKGFYCELGPCFPADWDIGVGSGWCTDYPDPYDVFLPFFFTGELDTYPFIDSAKYRAKIKADAKLVGNARLRAFGRLDLEIMNKLAPVAVMRTYNNRYFFSHRVNPGSLSYQGVYSAWSIPALALK
jgi:ABC-type oligopeptide transport system substrate-binding subunit